MKMSLTGRNSLTADFLISEGLADIDMSLMARAMRFQNIHLGMSLDVLRRLIMKEFRVPDVNVWNGLPISKNILEACNPEWKRLKRFATRIGLTYYPALYCEGVNPKAYVSAERVLAKKHGYWSRSEFGEKSWGGWDSYGKRGLSPFEVKTMWFLAGCKDSQKFQMQVRTGIRAKKGDSFPFFRNFIRGLRWVTKNHLSQRGIHHPFGRKTLAALGRLSPAMRWAAVSGLDLSGDKILRIRDLNWNKVKECQGLKVWQICQRLELPVRLEWQLSGLKVPSWSEMSHTVKLKDRNLSGRFGPFDVSPKVLSSLADLELEEFLPRLGLHLFWGKELPRALNEIYKGLSLHDAGQDLTSLEPSVYRNKDVLTAWRKLAWLTSGESLKYTARYDNIFRLFGTVPTGLKELKEMSRAVIYNGITAENKEIAELCGTYHVSQEGFEDYCELFLSPQPDFHSIPMVEVEDGEWLLQRLETDNKLGPFLGLATNCCQHLHSAGSDCAEAIWKNKDSAAWVIWKGEIIVAQSFIWRDGEALIIDSVEALSSDYADKITELYLAAIRQTMVWGIKSVWIAGTSYGITNLVRNRFVHQSALIGNPYRCPASYSDAQSVVQIAELMTEE